MDWETKLPTTATSMSMDARCSCNSRKRTKVPCFPYSPTFHEDYDLDKKKKNVGEKNSLYNKELNYKQLWCAPLQKEMQPGKKKTKKEKNHLTLNKQTMKHNATVEKYKANNVITRWSLQGDITLLCD